ncbi:hypothetical protein HZA96_07285 [Candidatus Woesearchaeota archaeon]|nr:hypothetical protein [Candidatus Woesearchaeota archaeon]
MKKGVKRIKKKVVKRTFVKPAKALVLRSPLLKETQSPVAQSNQSQSSQSKPSYKTGLLLFLILIVALFLLLFINTLGKSEAEKKDTLFGKAIDFFSAKVSTEDPFIPYLLENKYIDEATKQELLDSSLHLQKISKQTDADMLFKNILVELNQEYLDDQSQEYKDWAGQAISAGKAATGLNTPKGINTKTVGLTGIGGRAKITKQPTATDKAKDILAAAEAQKNKPVCDKTAKKEISVTFSDFVVNTQGSCSSGCYTVKLNLKSVKDSITSVQVYQLTKNKKELDNAEIITLINEKDGDYSGANLNEVKPYVNLPQNGCNTNCKLRVDVVTACNDAYIFNFELGGELANLYTNAAITDMTINPVPKQEGESCNENIEYKCSTGLECKDSKCVKIKENCDDYVDNDEDGKKKCEDEDCNGYIWSSKNQDMLCADGKAMVCNDEADEAIGSISDLIYKTYGIVLNAGGFDVLCAKNGIYNTWYESNPDGKVEKLGKNGLSVPDAYGKQNGGPIITANNCQYLSAFYPAGTTDYESWIGCGCKFDDDGVKAVDGDKYGGYECSNMVWEKITTESLSGASLVVTATPSADELAVGYNDQINKITFTVGEKTTIISTNGDVFIKKIKLSDLLQLCDKHFCGYPEIKVDVEYADSSSTSPPFNSYTFSLNNDNCYNFLITNSDNKVDSCDKAGKGGVDAVIDVSTKKLIVVLDQYATSAYAYIGASQDPVYIFKTKTVESFDLSDKNVFCGNKICSDAKITLKYETMDYKSTNEVFLEGQQFELNKDNCFSYTTHNPDLELNKCNNFVDASGNADSYCDATHSCTQGNCKSNVCTVEAQAAADTASDAVKPSFQASVNLQTKRLNLVINKLQVGLITNKATNQAIGFGEVPSNSIDLTTINTVKFCGDKLCEDSEIILSSDTNKDDTNEKYVLNKDNCFSYDSIKTEAENKKASCDLTGAAPVSVIEPGISVAQGKAYLWDDKIKKEYKIVVDVSDADGIKSVIASEEYGFKKVDLCNDQTQNNCKAETIIGLLGYTSNYFLGICNKNNDQCSTANVIFLIEIVDAKSTKYKITLKPQNSYYFESTDWLKDESQKQAPFTEEAGKYCSCQKIADIKVCKDTDADQNQAIGIKGLNQKVYGEVTTGDSNSNQEIISEDKCINEIYQEVPESDTVYEAYCDANSDVKYMEFPCLLTEKCKGGICVEKEDKTNCFTPSTTTISDWPEISDWSSDATTPKAICAGTYELSAPITFQNDDIHVLCQEGVVFKPKADNTEKIGMTINSLKNIIVEGCTFQDFNTAIQVKGASDNAIIKKNTFKNSVLQNSISSDSFTGNSIIHANTFETNDINIKASPDAKLYFAENTFDDKATAHLEGFTTLYFFKNNFNFDTFNPFLILNKNKQLIITDNTFGSKDAGGFSASENENVLIASNIFNVKKAMQLSKNKKVSIIKNTFNELLTPIDTGINDDNGLLLVYENKFDAKTSKSTIYLNKVQSVVMNNELIGDNIFDVKSSSNNYFVGIDQNKVIETKPSSVHFYYPIQVELKNKDNLLLDFAKLEINNYKKEKVFAAPIIDGYMYGDKDAYKNFPLYFYSKVDGEIIALENPLPSDGLNTVKVIYGDELDKTKSIELTKAIKDATTLTASLQASFSCFSPETSFEKLYKFPKYGANTFIEIIKLAAIENIELIKKYDKDSKDAQLAAAKQCAGSNYEEEKQSTDDNELSSGKVITCADDTNCPDETTCNTETKKCTSSDGTVYEQQLLNLCVKDEECGDQTKKCLFGLCVESGECMDTDVGKVSVNEKSLLSGSGQNTAKGINFLVAGYVVDEAGKKQEDSCSVNEKELTENLCSGGNWEPETVDCSKVLENGVCKNNVCELSVTECTTKDDCKDPAKPLCDTVTSKCTATIADFDYDLTSVKDAADKVHISALAKEKGTDDKGAGVVYTWEYKWTNGAAAFSELSADKNLPRHVATDILKSNFPVELKLKVTKGTLSDEKTKTIQAPVCYEDKDCAAATPICAQNVCIANTPPKGFAYYDYETNAVVYDITDPEGIKKIVVTVDDKDIDQKLINSPEINCITNTIAQVNCKGETTALYDSSPYLDEITGVPIKDTKTGQVMLYNNLACGAEYEDEEQTKISGYQCLDDVTIPVTVTDGKDAIYKITLGAKHKYYYESQDWSKADTLKATDEIAVCDCPQAKLPAPSTTGNADSSSSNNNDGGKGTPSCIPFFDDAYCKQQLTTKSCISGMRTLDCLSKNECFSTKRYNETCSAISNPETVNHCFNNKKDSDEQQSDCGGDDCKSCPEITISKGFVPQPLSTPDPEEDEEGEFEEEADMTEIEDEEEPEEETSSGVGKYLVYGIIGLFVIVLLVVLLMRKKGSATLATAANQPTQQYGLQQMRQQPMQYKQPQQQMQFQQPRQLPVINAASEQQLKSYINKQLESGMAKETITQTLETSGWKAEDVEKVFTEQLHHVLPADYEQKLKQFISYYLDRGMTREEVRAKLITGGWHEDVVDNYLK